MRKAGHINWQGVGTDIDKALALRGVFTAPQIMASAQTGRISSLLGKIKTLDARSYITEVTPNVTRLLNEAEVLLKPNWVAEMHA